MCHLLLLVKRCSRTVLVYREQLKVFQEEVLMSGEALRHPVEEGVCGHRVQIKDLSLHRIMLSCFVSRKTSAYSLMFQLVVMVCFLGSRFPLLDLVSKEVHVFHRH
uniref:Uncharacterized protein n=1 Tax=Brassica oleracea TaxID=3712 RepID=A0A3P6D9P0_BRAOL|nr:unnamed protein product [Brassica oleracea]